MQIIHQTDTHIETRTQRKNSSTSNIWIANNKVSLDIPIVIHTGDIVNHGIRSKQFPKAAACYEPLWNADIPVLFAIGNHDYDIANVESSKTKPAKRFNQYFGTSRFIDKPWFGGVYQEGYAENVYYKLDIHGQKFIFIALEYKPRDAVLEWANTVVTNHPLYNVVIATHVYMDASNLNVRRPTGDRIWNDFAKLHPNIQLILSGHAIYPLVAGKAANGSRRIDTGDHGNSVQQLFYDFQAVRGQENWKKYHGDRGNGRFRTHTINQTTGHHVVSNYSPVIGDVVDDLDHNFEYPFTNLLTGQ